MKDTFKMLCIELTLLIITFYASEVFGQGIYIDLGKSDAGRYMKLVGNTAGAEGEIKNTTAGSEDCAENIKTSMFFQLDENFFYQLPAGKFTIINVEYFDEPGVEIKLFYDAIDEANREHGKIIRTAGTNQWKSYDFYLDDSYFGHRQANGADFSLVASSGKMHINALSVVLFDYYFDFGAVNDSLGMNWVERGGGDSKTTIVTVEGEEAIQTMEKDNYLYMTVNDSLIFGDINSHPNLFVSVEYYDNNSAQTMRLQYNSSENPYKRTNFVAGKGGNCWRTITFELNDAWLFNMQAGMSDMRLHITSGGTPVNRIMIGVLSNTTGLKKDENIPEKFALSQNYPNPFNPSTDISYSLPYSEFVTISVYDLLGTQVGILVNEQKSAGTYNISWDAGDLSSGIYLFRINAGSFTEIKKMLLLR